MGPLGAAEAPGAAFHSADGRAKAGGHNDFMAPRTRALKTVDGAPSSTADKSPGSHRELHSSGMLERGHHISVPHCSEDHAAAIRAKGSPFCAGRRPRRPESAWNPKFEDTQRTFTYPAVIYLRNYPLSRYLRRAVARLKNDLPKRAAVARLPPRCPAPKSAQR